MADSIISQMCDLERELDAALEDIANRERLVNDGVGVMGTLYEVRNRIRCLKDAMVQAQANGTAIQVIFNPINPTG